MIYYYNVVKLTKWTLFCSCIIMINLPSVMFDL